MRAFGQVAVERGLLVHAEEAGVGLDVALGVDGRAEQARRHLLDGAEVAEVDAGFAGDLVQREAGVLAGGADDVADALVRNIGGRRWRGDEIGIVVGDDAQMRRVAARGAGLGVFLGVRACVLGSIAASAAPTAGTVIIGGLRWGWCRLWPRRSFYCPKRKGKVQLDSPFRLTPTALTTDYEVKVAGLGLQR